MSKLKEVDGHILPGWTGYNSHLNSPTILPCQTGIPSSPTRVDTVYTILYQSVAIADNLELDSFVLVMNQALLQSTADSVEKLFIQGAIGYSPLGLPHIHDISRYNREAHSIL